MINIFLPTKETVVSRKIQLTLLVAALLALIAGCGGGEESNDAGGGGTGVIGTGSLSKAQFVKRVNALCLRDQTKLYQQATNNLKKESNGNIPAPATYKETLETILIPGFESQIHEIEQIG